MTWLLGTMAGVLIWCALLTGIGGCIRNSPGEAEDADWAEWEQEIRR